jgi:uncharacterized protein (TIGR02145 family)
MFGKADNNGDRNTHNFLYVPVTNPITGRTWLNHNLGAEYADTNSRFFRSARRFQGWGNDHYAYGSLFQWGRKADGHELIRWTGRGVYGTGVYGTTTTRSKNPTDAKFIKVAPATKDWRGAQDQDDSLWANDSSTNNVCPVGYKLPTPGEWDVEIDSWNTVKKLLNNTHSTSKKYMYGTLRKSLILPMSGVRDGVNGGVYRVDSQGNYWSASVSGLNARNITFGPSTSVTWGNSTRARGYAVRCIKDE